MLSWIQYHILVELTRHSKRRYSQLRPSDVEGNVFAYHLNGLIKEGLVEKAEREYTLTIEGLQFVGTLSLKTGRPRKQPKILTAIIAKNDEGEYLFSRWYRQPNANRISFPHGMVHYGESIDAMAALELAEKAGLAAKLTYMGDVYIRGVRLGEVDRHMLVHLFKAVNIQPDRLSEIRPDVSEPFWAHLSDLSPDEFVPGFFEIAQLVDKSPHGAIFADLTVTVQ